MVYVGSGAVVDTGAEARKASLNKITEGVALAALALIAILSFALSGKNDVS